MRAHAIALVLVLVPAAAQAEGYMEIGGGLDIPVSDDEYTRYVDPSANLFIRFGRGGPPVSGLFSMDWTPLAADSGSYLDFNRFRFMGHVAVRKQIAPKVELSGRFGAGLDIIHESFELVILGTRYEGSDTDLGLALEAAGGAWVSVGSGSVQVGGELVVPISFHSSDGNPNNPNDPNNPRFEFTSVDLQVLAGVRLRL